MSGRGPQKPSVEVTFDGRSKPDTRLMELVYDELRALAGSYLKHERAGHTLQATALVHEAYMRISEVTGIHWKSPAHFFAFAAEVIRRVLVDHARKRNAAKRGGGQPRVDLTPTLMSGADGVTIDVLDLNAALEALAEIDTRAAQTVELRYFGGLTTEEIADVLGVSPRSVSNHWAFGKAWLFQRLRTDGGS
jgi:RNA polymerase sigma factor (TIGR02999 family)